MHRYVKHNVCYLEACWVLRYRRGPLTGSCTTRGRTCLPWEHWHKSGATKDQRKGGEGRGQTGSEGGLWPWGECGCPTRMNSLDHAPFELNVRDTGNFIQLKYTLIHSSLQKIFCIFCRFSTNNLVVFP